MRYKALIYDFHFRFWPILVSVFTSLSDGQLLKNIKWNKPFPPEDDFFHSVKQ